MKRISSIPTIYALHYITLHYTTLHYSQAGGEMWVQFASTHASPLPHVSWRRCIPRTSWRIFPRCTYCTLREHVQLPVRLVMQRLFTSRLNCGSYSHRGGNFHGSYVRSIPSRAEFCVFIPELYTGHFFWTRPDPAKRWPDPTRNCRQKVWPDPTRGPTLPHVYIL